MNKIDSERLHYLYESTIVLKIGIYVNQSNEHLLAYLFASPNDSHITLSFFVDYVCWANKYVNECSSCSSYPTLAPIDLILDAQLPPIPIPWSQVSGGPLPPLYPRMLTVALTEGPLPSPHSLYLSPWAVGLVFWALQGSMRQMLTEHFVTHLLIFSHRKLLLSLSSQRETRGSRLIKFISQQEHTYS